jgi:pyridoxine 5'-phosphate synthase PdxJ
MMNIHFGATRFTVPILQSDTLIQVLANNQKRFNPDYLDGFSSAWSADGDTFTVTLNPDSKPGQPQDVEALIASVLSMPSEFISGLNVLHSESTLNNEPVQRSMTNSKPVVGNH